MEKVVVFTASDARLLDSTRSCVEKLIDDIHEPPVALLLLYDFRMPAFTILNAFTPTTKQMKIKTSRRKNVSAKIINN
ncbi:MAG TPA: hypothetical protein GX525_06820 [Bacilli bacterium]|nr:hypothetical protein [Bacilli bacterium]